MSSSTKVLFGIGILISVVVISLIAIFFTQQSFNRKAGDFETNILRVVADCAQIKTNSINAIIMLADVDANTKEFLKAAVNGDKKVSGAFDEVVTTGNSANFLMMLSGIIGTNFTVTAENVQHEIVSYNDKISLCGKTMLEWQNSYKRHLGFNANNQVTQFPENFYQPNSGYPTYLNNPDLLDLDHDGKTTVLDFRPPVSVKVQQEYNTGEDSGPVDLYNK
jgi:hypothetical protein